MQMIAAPSGFHTIMGVFRITPKTIAWFGMPGDKPSVLSSPLFTGRQYFLLNLRFLPAALHKIETFVRPSRHVHAQQHLVFNNHPAKSLIVGI